MKIQNTNSIMNYVFERTNERKQSIVTNNMSSTQNAYEVIISKEGFDSYRESLNKEANSYRKHINKEILSKAVIEKEGLLKSDFHSRFKKMNAQIALDNGEYGANELYENCFKVYSMMYDEIKQGYAEGTRDLYVIDPSSEEGFRKITEEDELAALDAAFDFYAKVVDGYVNRVKIDGTMQDAMNKLRQDIESQRYTGQVHSQKEEINKHTKQDMKLDIYNDLMSLTKIWKSEYTINVNAFSLCSQILKDNAAHYDVK